jgi:hypothetical protein
VPTVSNGDGRGRSRPALSAGSRKRTTQPEHISSAFALIADMPGSTMRGRPPTPQARRLVTPVSLTAGIDKSERRPTCARRTDLSLGFWPCKNAPRGSIDASQSRARRRSAAGFRFRGSFALRRTGTDYPTAPALLALRRCMRCTLRPWPHGQVSASDRRSKTLQPSGGGPDADV